MGREQEPAVGSVEDLIKNEAIIDVPQDPHDFTGNGI